MKINKLLTTLLLVSSTLTAGTVLAAEKYVSDDLSTFLRRGPSVQYGLSGTLNAGEKVTVLEVSADGKFTQIRDARGRVAWIESSALSDLPSLKVRIPELEQQIETLKQEIANTSDNHLNTTADLRNAVSVSETTISNLTTENQDLKLQVIALEKEIDSLNNHLDEKRQSLILTWFLYGGLVAGGGLLLGLILPIIMPRRRKKDRWMN
ncbi:TIGR04211 family SH3 domain-containing protein [Zophobihabitans entericus]|uniref:SH3 domain-containing protein n=1 Tax=Zophobihabitans entericus TaxID=1635327 RepID=A0A6G9ID61_9GAMM|nr:TIGR04211 family SH3 domain-containing protein [Zophobihabitans entericus]QIQ21777.1 SH3 domain-containing protein [Zophobihabitans entericus]